MTEKAIVDFINSIELEFPVNTWEIDGLHIWPIIRIKLGFELSNKDINNDKKTTKISKNRNIFQLLFTIIKIVCFWLIDFKSNEVMNKKADIMFLFSAGNRTEVNKRWYIKQAYPIIFDLNKNKKAYFCVEDISTGLFRIPRVERSQFLLSQLIKRINRKSSNKIIKKIYLPGFNDFIKILDKNNLNYVNYSEHILINEYKQILNQKDYFIKKLKKVRPKLCVVICYYGFAYGFLAACHELGVESADLQHGVAGKDMFAYGRWMNVPEAGYELLPSKFLSWSRSDSDAINAWSSKTIKHDAINIGNTWIDFWKNSKEDFIFINKNIVSEYIKKLNKPLILFTHQSPFGFPEWLLITIKELNEYYWGIRLHPSDIKSKKRLEHIIKKNEIKNVDYKFCTETPLPALLDGMDLHITGWSATVYEAIEYGKYSIVLHEKGIEIFKKEINSGECDSALSSEELSKKIKQTINKRISLITDTEANKKFQKLMNEL